MKGLKEWRLKRGLSREAVAAMANVSLSTYIRWEKEKGGVPDYYQLKKISNGLGIKLVSMLREIEESE